MAKTITERTLTGYRDYKTNVKYIEDLTDTLKNDIEEGKQKVEEAFNQVKFDVVIGNPPYQESDGGAKASATPIYNRFVELSKSIEPKYISLIMPTRWYSGGKGLDKFRDEMLSDSKIQLLIDFPNPDEVFHNTNIRGGVCIVNWNFEWDANQQLTNVITFENGKETNNVMRPLRVPESVIFIRDYLAISIIDKINKVTPQHEGRISDFTSPLKPYGFRGFFIRDKRFHADENNLVEPIKCFGKGVVGFVERSEIEVRPEWIDKWKVFTARANNIGTELKDDNFNTIIGNPGTICTETYIVIGADLDLDKYSAENLSKYLKTKFSRMLHGIAKSSHDAARTTYKFIPLQDFTLNSDIDWRKSIADIDQQLYKKYGLSEEEIQFIESKVKEME